MRSATLTHGACVGLILRSLESPVGGQVAQLVEQRTENPRVGSSILPLATILFKDLRQPIWLPFFAVCKFGVIVATFSARLSKLVTDQMLRDPAAG